MFLGAPRYKPVNPVNNEYTQEHKQVCIENTYDVVVALQEKAEGKANKAQEPRDGQSKNQEWKVQEHVLKGMQKVHKGSIKVDKSTDHKSEVVHHYRSVLTFITDTVKEDQDDDHIKHAQHAHCGLFFAAKAI